MKSSRILVTLLAAAIAFTAFAIVQPANARPGTGLVAQATATATSDDIVVNPPGGSTAIPPAPVVSSTPDKNPITNPGGTPGATAVPVVPPKLTPPPTLDDLLKLFPDLQPYVNSNQTIDNMDLPALYKKLVAIYNKSGASGLAVFLKDSGLLEKFNLPVSYLDLLMVYDQGGLIAVQKLATDRGLINSQNEIVAEATLADASNLDQVVADMKKLGVTTYPPLNEYGQLQIGIPIEVLSNYQTPGTLIGYLVKVATVKNVSAINPPLPRRPAGKVNVPYFTGKGPTAVGATAWQKAGFTGKGVRVGVLDMGFGGIKKLMNGKDLPKTIKTSRPIDELDAQDEAHGTACAEVVHGAAPDAELFIAFFDDNASWNDAVQFLVDSKVQIISYSVGSSVGPRDGSFGESVFVDQFVKKTGILWVNAAGNEAYDHTSFKYNDTKKDGQHHFSADNDSLPFEAFDPHTTVTLNWNGSWTGSEKDEYTFSIVDKDGNEVADASEPKKGRKNDYPFQIVTFDATPETVYYMVIKKSHAKADNTMDIFINNGALPSWARVPGHSVTVPADARAALSVGATGLTKDKIEFYSSQGPTNDGRLKPDVSAPTGEVLPNEPDGFNGTSGATPLVSGVAALVLQAYPNLSANEVKAFIMKNVKDLGAAGPDPVFGTGRIALPDPATINSDQGPDTDATPAPPDASADATLAPSATPSSKKTPVATKPPKGGPASAVIEKSDVQFNVTVKNVKGIKIVASFQINNMKGKTGAVALQVFKADGTTPVTPKTKDFTIGKTLGTGGLVKPKYDSAEFSDIDLFLPNTEFGSLPKGSNDLVYVITILDISDENNPSILVQSDPVAFTVTKK